MPNCNYEINNRNYPERRISRPSPNDSLTCSHQSVLSAMDRFVKAVNNMDSTVLVPSRLQDMDIDNVNSKFSKCLPTDINDVDVYAFYNVLKDVKNELLWGSTSSVESTPILPSNDRTSQGSTRVMKHIRQPSADSLGNTVFTSDLETDSDVESAEDSMDEHPTAMPSENHLANSFRHHLLGLHRVLHKLSDSADYLSSIYQEEIESPS